MHGEPRRRSAVALVSGLAVCLSLVAAGPARAQAAAPAPQNPRAAASAQARADGRPVAVPALATADSSTMANPNGTFTTTAGLFGSDGALATTQVAEGCPNSTRGYGTADSGVGFDTSGPCAGINRTFLDLSLAGLSSADDVLSSTFDITSDYSAEPDCSAADAAQVALDWTGPIGARTDWRDQPRPLSNASVPKPMATDPVTADGNSSGSSCGGVEAVFTITSEIAYFVGRSDGDVTVGMYGAEKPKGGFERFAVSSAELITTYDVAPAAPTNLTAVPTPELPGGAAAPCGSVAAPGFAAADSGGIQTLTAAVSSAVGGALQAAFTVNDLTAGTSSTATVSAISGDTADYQAPVVDGHEYSWSVTASDGTLTSAPSATCAFISDQTPPTGPVVTSTDFPPSSSGQTGLSTGQTGTLSVSSSDPGPASGGPASGLAGFYYSFDDPVAAFGSPFVAASATGTATITYGTSEFGTHILYIQAADLAGNVSQQLEYTFFVPQAPGKPVPGDVNGDLVPDLVTTNSSGDLVEFPGGSELGTGPVMLSTPTNSVYGDSWADYDFAHYGSFTNGGVDDLVVYSPAHQFLFIYRNGGSTIGGNFDDTSEVSEVRKEATCQATSTGSCAGYDSTDWSGLTSITTPGDLLAGDPVSGVDNGRPGLLTVENGSLWYYPGGFGTFFDTAIPLGTGGWNGFTLLDPGTAGGQPVVWARDDATGVVYQYPITFDSAGDPVDLGTPTSGSGTALTVPAGDGQTGSLPAAQYSAVYAVDLHGDGDPDLVAVTPSGDVIDWPGAATASGATAAFGTPVTLGNVDSAS
jgi:hypothetical protein